MDGLYLFVLIAISFSAYKGELGMARITLGSIVNSIKGSIGEMVYSTWKGISYIRRKATTSQNAQSSDQEHIRIRLAECSKYWYDTLTQPQRDAWETYAASLPVGSSSPGDIIKPALGPFSGYTAFLRNNILAYSAGISAIGVFIAAAPIGVTPPDAPVSVSGSWVAPNLVVTWSPGTVPGTRARIWIRSIDNKFHGQVRTHEAVAVGTKNVTSIAGRLGQYIALANAPGIYEIQMDSVDANGQCSPPSTLVRNINVT